MTNDGKHDYQFIRTKMIETMKNDASESIEQVESKEQRAEEVGTEKEGDSGLQVAPQGKDDEQAGEKNIL